MLQRVEGKGITTVIVNSFYRAATKEDHALSASHAGDQEGNTSSESIQNETFNRVVVQGTVRVRNVKPVVARMELGLGKVSQRSDIAKSKYLLYSHLFMCIARWRKYCHVSTMQTAAKNWSAGTRYQYSALAAMISQLAN